MAIIEINRDPSPRELRWFGVILAVFCGLLGAALRWRFAQPTAGLAVWGLGLGLILVYQAVPGLRRSLYVGWMRLFYPLGWVLSHLVLASIYYLLITPVGLILRLVGHDSMRRGPDPSADTYWIKRTSDTAAERYFRQS